MRSAPHGVHVWPAFTDLMGGIALVFLLVGAAAMGRAAGADAREARLRAELAKANDALAEARRQLADARRKVGVGTELVASLREQLRARGVEANVTSYGNLEIAADLLFETNRYDIPDDRAAGVRELGRTLLAMLAPRRAGKRIALILVIGHTDQVGSDEANLALSTKRAEELVRRWTADYQASGTGDGAAMRGGDLRCLRAKLVPAGMGKTRPLLADESSPAACGNHADETGCRKNRRIEIRLVPKEEATVELDGCP